MLPVSLDGPFLIALRLVYPMLPVSLDGPLGICAGFVLFVYICISVGDSIIKREVLGSNLPI
jgi:hypothetical protein